MSYQSPQTGVICYTGLSKTETETRTNIFVIDMDETLGYFTEISCFCNLLEYYYKYQEPFLFKEYFGEFILNDTHFFNLLNTFFMYIRPSMFTILLRVFLSKKPQDRVVLYTNNQLPKSWCERIVRFFEHHFSENYTDVFKPNGGKLFDTIIAAYKINNVQIEMKRTRHEKCVSDLINCLELPTDAMGALSNSTRFLFLDDVVHEQMIHPNVKYILCKPYVYCYDYRSMVETYYNLFMKNIHMVNYVNHEYYRNNFVTYMLTYLLSNGCTQTPNDDYLEHVNVSLKIVEEVRRFYLEE